MNSKQILEEIAKTQEQLNKLQEKLEETEKLEKYNDEFYTPVVNNHNYKHCIEFLKHKNPEGSLNYCFTWMSTPQGHLHWSNIEKGISPLTKEDIQQIKDWVINYLIKLNDPSKE